MEICYSWSINVCYTEKSSWKKCRIFLRSKYWSKIRIENVFHFNSEKIQKKYILNNLKKQNQKPRIYPYKCTLVWRVLTYIYSLRRKKAIAIHFANCGVWKENQTGTSRSNIKYWRARPKWHHWDTEKSEGNQIKPKFSWSLLAQTIFKIILKCKLGLRQNGN